MTDTALPDNLIALERSAWEEQQRGELTVDTAQAVHAAVGAYAEEAGLPRIDIEMRLKQTVRRGG